MRERRGNSLIEVIILMTAASVILSLIAVLMHRVMQSHNRSQATHADESTAWRLSSQLRGDLARATGAKLTHADDVTTLKLFDNAGELARYRFDSAGVKWQQARDEDRVATETFALAGPIDWQVKKLGTSGRIEVRTTTPLMTRTESLAPVKIHIIGRLAGPIVEQEATP